MVATALNFPTADTDVVIQGDGNAKRTIAIGQNTLGSKDDVVIASENWSITAAGVATLAGLGTFSGGLTAPNGTNSERFGANALAAITSGSGNTAFGNNAGNAVDSGDNNTLFGRGAGALLDSGSGNIFIGEDCGGNTTTGSTNILIGQGLYTTAVGTTGELRIHYVGGANIPLISGDMVGGLCGINTLAKRSATLNITTDDTDAVDCLLLDQDDDSEAIVSIEATSAASTVNPVTSFTTGNTIQGFYRKKINGTDYWSPFYDAPTS